MKLLIHLQVHNLWLNLCLSIVPNFKTITSNSQPHIRVFILIFLSLDCLYCNLDWYWFLAKNYLITEYEINKCSFFPLYINIFISKPKFNIINFFKHIHDITSFYEVTKFMAFATNFFNFINSFKIRAISLIF